MNSRPLGPEPSALPTALHPEISFYIIRILCPIVKINLHINHKFSVLFIEVTSMKDIQLYICSGIFIVLTAIKIISPQTAVVISDKIDYVLNMETEQTQKVIAFGSSLTKDDILDAVSIIYNAHEPK